MRHKRENRPELSVKKAAEAVGIAPSTYYRWRKLLGNNPEWVTQQQVHVESTAPKRNGMALPDEVQKRIVEMARSVLYKNPRQIAKALQDEGIKVGDNVVRSNQERTGLYGLRTVDGSNGKPIKKKVILC